jgi:hypothetical protein
MVLSLRTLRFFPAEALAEVGFVSFAVKFLFIAYKLKQLTKLHN